MSVSAALVDFGTDISGWYLTPPVWGTSSGFANLGNALARRFSTPLGALAPEHPEYGLDLRNYVNHAWSPSDLSALRSRIKAQAEQDPRVEHAAVDVSLGLANSTLSITLTISTAAGPFSLVLGVSELTVEILALDGKPVDATPSATSTQIVLVAGPQGPPGPPGAGGGGGGSGSAVIDIDESSLKGDSTGAEVIVFQSSYDFGTLGASLITSFSAVVKTVSGTATCRMRVGGTESAADGTLVASLTSTSTTFVKVSATGTLANPSGLQFVTITLQSPVGVDAQIEGVVATIR